MSRGYRRTAAPTVELTFFLDHLALEAHERPTAIVTDSTAFAVDDTAHLGRIEDIACERRVSRHRLDAVDDLGERELVGFEVGEEFEREFHELVACRTSHGSTLSRSGAG